MKQDRIKVVYTARVSMDVDLVTETVDNAQVEVDGDMVVIEAWTLDRDPDGFDILQLPLTDPDALRAASLADQNVGIDSLPIRWSP